MPLDPATLSPQDVDQLLEYVTQLTAQSPATEEPAPSTGKDIIGNIFRMLPGTLGEPSPQPLPELKNLLELALFSPQTRGALEGGRMRAAEAAKPQFITGPFGEILRVDPKTGNLVVAAKGRKEFETAGRELDKKTFELRKQEQEYTQAAGGRAEALQKERIELERQRNTITGKEYQLRREALDKEIERSTWPELVEAPDGTMYNRNPKTGDFTLMLTPEEKDRFFQSGNNILVIKGSPKEGEEAVERIAVGEDTLTPAQEEQAMRVAFLDKLAKEGWDAFNDNEKTAATDLGVGPDRGWDTAVMPGEYPETSLIVHFNKITKEIIAEPMMKHIQDQPDPGPIPTGAWDTLLFHLLGANAQQSAQQGAQPPPPAQPTRAMPTPVDPEILQMGSGIRTP